MLWLVFWVCFLISYLYFHFGIGISLLIALAVYACSGGYAFIRIFILTFPRDMRGLIIIKRLEFWQRWMNYKGYLIIDMFRWTAKKYASKTALLYDDQVWSFQYLEEFSNRVANVFEADGYKKGDVVALFMESRPAYVGVWLGMAKIGIVPALINFNLRGASLSHCIKDAKCKGIVYGLELSPAIQEIIVDIEEWHRTSSSTKLGIVSVDFGAGEQLPPVSGSRSLDEILSNAPSTAPRFYVDRSSRGPVSLRTPLIYIYTSGTTGLPKAAIINQGRYHFMSSAVTEFFKVTPADILYTSLPLYHTAGGIVGMGQVLLYGSSMLIRRKFSASRFWDECVQYRCTVVQYIGEICRYLLAQPPRPSETQHRVRLAFGNGIRPQLWEEFQRRFHVAQIGEFYGATESNANIINPENRVGAVGFTTRIAPSFHPVSIIRIDENTGEPLRDKNGLCIPCQPGEVGEMIGRITHSPIQNFDGYVNKTDTSKKMVYDVFSKGDQAFRSGDLLMMDDLGWIYFRDRLGDTFRWRGENVSTTEVEALLAACLDGQHSCVVFGVQVPNCEGRAGMACVEDTQHTVDVDKLAKDVCSALPAYARPLFLRLAAHIECTGTFKLKKGDLAKQGFEPDLCDSEDRLYYLDSVRSTYLPLTRDVFKHIVDGKIRF